MRFAHPGYLLLLLLLIPLGYFEYKKKISAIIFPDGSFFSRYQLRSTVLRYLPPALNMIVLILVTLAIARPQHGRIYEEIETQGVDIMLCMDVSTSMIADDFKPANRLTAAKQQAKEFIAKRSGDRIGLVVFAAAALTQCPLTFDQTILSDLIDYIDFGIIEDGTAIGIGLATAVSRLKDSKAKDKIIILLTDGANNRGEIDPISAAKLAQTYGIKVYGIGVGKNEPVTTYINHPRVGRGYRILEPADMNTIREITELTGGQAFLATDAQALATIYDEIDKLEPTTFKTTQHTLYSERAGIFMLPALIILLLAMVLNVTVFRRLP